jgi:hypothetical protein
MMKCKVIDKVMADINHKFVHGGIFRRDWFSDKLKQIKDFINRFYNRSFNVIYINTASWIFNKNMGFKQGSKLAVVSHILHLKISIWRPHFYTQSSFFDASLLPKNSDFTTVGIFYIQSSFLYFSFLSFWYI